MLKIQRVGLEIALGVAKNIQELEAMKDEIASQTVRLKLGRSEANPMAPVTYMDFEVGAADIRAVVDKALADNHRILRDHGIELLP